MSEEIVQRFPVDIENLKESIVDTLYGFVVVYGLLITGILIQKLTSKHLNKETRRKANERRELLQLKFESNIGIVVDLVLLTFHALSCTLYIYETYNLPPYSPGIQAIEVISNFFFALEFVKTVLLDDNW